MNKGAYFLKCAVGMLLLVLVVGWVVQILWNWLVPVLFHGPFITYAQALGLLVLSKILFSGIGGKRYADECKPSNGAPYWKQRFYEKFSTMKPEDREAFKQKMKEKWCRWEQNPAEGEHTRSND
ncbi:hypothetical protein [Dawidia soli]|uniref:Uncharacterized protein n=1 Tax=Dawidia soli TaxID=2782352 RepID=A0AAP2GI71_9BACT|nr:hypothetical protein [Dawidia soli]MBT1687936.1 hypothetical protein [Dawidia soli]